MSRTYTDKELVTIAQLAYCNLNSEEYRNMLRESQDGSVNLQELVTRELEAGSAYNLYFKYDSVWEDDSDNNILIRNDIENMLNDIAAGEICQDWKILDIKDDNTNSGMYAVTIETGDKCAVVGFRGSESKDSREPGSIEQTFKDWIFSDGGIASGDMTMQEIVAGKYLDSMGEKYQDYNFATAGHSLGGDLALVSAIYVAGSGASSDVASRLTQCKGLDAPGHPDEFIEKYQKELDVVSGIMSHDSWSLVGNIFTSLCEENGNHNNVLSDKFNGLSEFIDRHSMSSVEYDDSGMLVSTQERDGMAICVGGITELIDKTNRPQQLITGLATLAGSVAMMGYGMDDVDREAFFNSTSAGLKELSDGMYKILSTKYIVNTAGIETPIEFVPGIKCLSGFAGATVIFDFLFQCNSARLEYAEGDYRTGSTNMISFGTEIIYGFATSEMLATAAVAIGLAGWPIAVAAIAGAMVGYFVGEVVGDLLGDAICDILGYEDAEYSTAAAARRFVSDPLVIDMLGNGFNITNVKDGVYFDEDALGLIEKTDWISEDDALLALDINNDGIINDGSELFGTSTVMANGNKARNGFEALEQYDINGDRVIDDKDEIFGSLKVWQDKNHDGVSQQDELYTLDELGVSGISLNTELDDGIRVAEIKYADGSTRKIGEFTFSSQLYNTIEKEKVDVSDDIKGLPDIQAIGRLNSLHTLIQIDETGTLKGYVEQFVASTDRDEKHNLVEKILQFACGAENISAGSRGGLVDARRMSVIEHVMGRDYVGTEGRNPVNTAAPILNNIYTNICNTYYCMLDSQAGMKNYLSMTFWDVDSNGNKILNTDIFDAFVKACEMNGYDVSDIVGDMGYYIKTMNMNNATNFENFCETYVDRIDDIKAIADVCGMNVLSGSEEANVINGSGQSDFIHGLGGSDTLRGGDGNDFIYGQEGNDTIYGENGNDTLVGGQGSDYIEGGSGADTYVHTRGDGNDTIYNLDYSSGRVSDKLILKGVNSDEAEIKRSGNSLVITDTVSGEVITVSNAFNWGDGRAYLEKVEFDDGVVFGKTELAERSLVINGSEANDSLSGFGWSYNYSTHETFYAGDGNDTVSGNDGNDTIHGEAGNDTLYGGNGNDTIVGGSGNDYMEGGSDTDTYIHTRGDGSDTIYNLDYSAGRASDKLIFRGVNSDEADIKRSGNSLIITDTVSGEVITVSNAFNWGDGRAYLEKVEFDDGVVFGKAELAERSLVINGSDANDSLSGFGWSYNYSTHETFYAGDGNDTVSGNDGNDTIYGEAGNDTLYGGNGNDTIVGGSGNDYMEGGSDADTYIHTRGDGNDTIYNLDYSAGRASDKLIFRGVNSDEADIKRSGNSLIITDTVSGEVITVTNAFNWGDGRAYLEKVEFEDGVVFGKTELADRSLVINGSEANDSLSGYGWSYNYSTHETFYAGDGNDTVSGNDGNDTIYGEAGNDSLYGGNGNDTIVGGSGNDYMEGGSDADTYIHTRGEGSDTIYNIDYSAGRVSDKLILRGVNSDEVKIKRSGNSLIITDTVSGEVITVTNAFNWGDGRAYLEKVEFDDGVVFGKAELAERSLVINGSDANDSLSGFGWSYNYSTHETFYAGDGDDVVNGYDGNDTIYGETGNDKLYGGNGNDTIVGGSGNDYMEGGSDADTYIHIRGDGSDTIYNLDYSAGRVSDKLVLKGTNSTDVVIKRSGNSLIITDTVSGEVITVSNAFNWGDGRAYLEKVEFEDDVIFGKAELAERTLVINGSDANDSLSGFGWSYNYSTHETFYAGDGDDTVSGNDGNDTIYGENGNDKLYGGNGSDTIVGGLGNDYMEGGSDVDTYIYTRGEGSDTIYNLDYSTGRVSDKLVLKGVNSTDVSIKRSGNSLVITDIVSGENITVSNAFNWGDGRAYLEKVEFDDGVVFGKAELAERSLVINGSDANDSLSGFGWSYNYSTHETFYAGDGNDTVSGNDGNDTIYGESGNDALYGGNGNDTIVGGSGNDYMEGGSDADLYIHTRGDGSDTIYNLDYSAGRGSDKLILRGVNSDEAEIKRSGNSLIITDTVSGEVITVSNAFNWGDGRAYLEKVEFDDGVVFGKAELAERSLVINGSDANDSLSGFGWSYNYSTHETFYAGDGNDTVSGNEGNDTIFGEDGADKLYGGNGNDTIVGGSGNDYMEGGSDTDTYVHTRGEGSDTIYNLDYSAGRVSDKLIMKGTNSTDVVIKRSGNSLIITDTVSGEVITVSNAFNWGDGRAYLEKVEFDDGVVFGKAELAERSLVVNGSDANDSLSGFGWSYNYSTHETFYAGDGNDTVSGNDGNDTIYGESGNDTLYGGNGNDTIVGGSGNDYMEGGSDSDTYIHTRGDGSDTIYNLDYSAGRVSDKLVLRGVNSTDVSIKRFGNSLVLTDNVSGEIITVSNAFNWGDGRAYLEKVEFEDGVVFGKAELAERSLVINGSDANDSLSGFGWSYNYSTHETFYAGDGNDTVSGNDGDDTIYGENGNDSIYGGNGNDILVGGSGNDYLEGGSGADIYIHNRGDGSDTIYNIDYSASRTSDKLILNGVKAEDAEVTRNGNHLVIKDTIGDETITIKDAYNWGDGRSQLNNVEFDDATAVVNYATASLTLEYKEIVPVIEEEATEFDESVISSNDFEAEIVVENIEDINSAVQTDSIVQEMINEASLDNVSDSDITNMADLIVQEMSGSIISDNVSDELNLTKISEDTSYDQLWVS